MQTPDLIKTLDQIQTSLNDVQADNEIKQAEYNATQTTCREIEELKAKNTTLKNQISSHKETLKRDEGSYQTLTQRIDENIIEKNTVSTEFEKMRAKLSKAKESENNIPELPVGNTVLIAQVESTLQLKQDELNELKRNGTSSTNRGATYSQTSLDVSYLKSNPSQQKLHIDTCDASTLETAKQRILKELSDEIMKIVKYKAEEQAQKDERDRLKKEENAAKNRINELNLQEQPLKTLLELSEREFAIEEKRIIESCAILAKAKADVQFLNDRLEALNEQYQEEEHGIGLIMARNLLTLESTIETKRARKETLKREHQELFCTIGKNETNRHNFIKAVDDALKHLNDHDEIKGYGGILKIANEIRGYYDRETEKYQELEAAFRNNTIGDIAIDLTSERSNIKTMKAFLENFEKNNIEPVRAEVRAHNERKTALDDEIKNANDTFINQRKDLDSNLKGFKDQTEGLEKSAKDQRANFGKNVT
ncbi:MAG: hypothetical protein KDK71_10475, partial [Chlamydiia bacterium]|nr:hypothetical protein [Chlamydiia bacterium]